MDDHLEVLQRPEDLLIYILMSLFLLSNVTAIVMCLFLPSISSPVAKKSVRQKLLSTCQVLKTMDIWLLIPIFFFCGIMPASIYSSFTQVNYVYLLLIFCGFEFFKFEIKVFLKFLRINSFIMVTQLVFVTSLV